MTHAVGVCSSRKQWSHVNHSQQACSSQELCQALRPEEEVPSSLQGGVPGKLTLQYFILAIFLGMFVIVLVTTAAQNYGLKLLH